MAAVNKAIMFLASPQLNTSKSFLPLGFLKVFLQKNDARGVSPGVIGLFSADLIFTASLCECKYGEASVNLLFFLLNHGLYESSSIKVFTRLKRNKRT